MTAPVEPVEPVEPVAPVEVLGDAELRVLVVGPMATNAYLLTCRRTGAQALVDPGDEAGRLRALVEASGDGRLSRVVVTHRHHDHLDALAEVVAATGAPVAAGADDAAAVTEATGVAVTTSLRDGDELHVGAVPLAVVALRGHTPGAVALALTEPATGRVHLLTGDSLFPGGVGNTGQDPARFSRLLDDVEERLFGRYDDATTVRPGHGAATTLGAERPALPAWRARGW